MIGKEVGQADLPAGGSEHKPGVLDRIDDELDWRRFGKTLGKGLKDCKDSRSSYPPVMPFKGLLLQQRDGVNDRMAEEAIGAGFPFAGSLAWGSITRFPTRPQFAGFGGDWRKKGWARKIFFGRG